MQSARLIALFNVVRSPCRNGGLNFGPQSCPVAVLVDSGMGTLGNLAHRPGTAWDRVALCRRICRWCDDVVAILCASQSLSTLGALASIQVFFTTSN